MACYRYSYLPVTLLYSILLMIVNCSPHQATILADQLANVQADDCPITTSYHAWFFNPPQGSITGYPQKGIPAAHDAQVRIQGYSRMFVKGKLRYFSDGSYDDKQDSISFYYDESDTLANKNYSIVDSFFICCPASVCLMSINTKSGIDTAEISACESSGSPYIVDTAMLYAKGTSKFNLYDQASSWMTAEEQAIKTLCRQSAFYFASQVKMSDDRQTTDVRKVIRYEMDLEVKNLRVISRSYDVVQNACIVSVACNKTDISPWKGTPNE